MRESRLEVGADFQIRLKFIEFRLIEKRAWAKPAKQKDNAVVGYGNSQSVIGTYNLERD